MFLFKYREVHIENMEEISLTKFSYIYDLIMSHMLTYLKIWILAMIEPLQKEKYEFT